MIFKHPLCIFFTLLAFIACNTQTKEKRKTEEEEIAEITKIDSATEPTMLNPKFEKSKIYGFGVFKIGTSIDSSIIYLIKASGYSFDSLSNFTKKSQFKVSHPFFEKNKNIFKINHGKSTLERTYEIDNATWCKNSNIFWIPSYTIDKINIQNLNLTYYKNKLVFISCDWSLDLITAVESKFGKPDENIVDAKQKPIYTSKQWYNQDLKSGTTTSALSNIIGETFEIKIKGGFKFLNGCEKRCFEEQNKIDKETKKLELKNF